MKILISYKNNPFRNRLDPKDADKKSKLFRTKLINLNITEVNK